MPQTESDDKKLCILNCAISLFARLGFSGVSIRQIAEKSGCNLAAISYYFGGKEKLYSECLNVLDPQKLEKICSVLNSPQDREDMEQKLTQFCSEFCLIVHDYSQIVRIFINQLNANESYSPNLENTLFGPVMESIRGFLQEGINKNILKNDINTILIGRMILSLSITEVIYSPATNLTFEEFSKELIKNCTGSIYA